jgi:hypothetical protein
VWRARTLLAAALALLAAACDGPGVASPGRRTVGIAGAGSAATSIVGTWRRAVFFLDAFGIARSSETSWQFGADGAVARILVTRNLTFGLADVQVSAGRYRLQGARVIIDFVTPTVVQLTLDVRRVGNDLELAGERYLPVEN